MKFIVAVDPGASGGIAWRGEDGSIGSVSMPDTRGDCIQLLKRDMRLASLGNVVAYHEKVRSFIPDGGASQMMEFGRNVERVACIIETLGVRLVEVDPKVWQAHFNLGGAGRMKVPSAPSLRIPKNASPRERRELKSEHKFIRQKFLSENAAQIKSIKAQNAKAKGEWKNKLKAEAQRRFPDRSVTLNTADALLILDYAISKESQL